MDKLFYSDNDYNDDDDDDDGCGVGESQGIIIKNRFTFVKNCVGPWIQTHYSILFYFYSDIYAFTF